MESKKVQTIDEIIEKIKREVERRNSSGSSDILSFGYSEIQPQTMNSADSIAMLPPEVNGTLFYRFLRKVQRIFMKLNIYSVFSPLVSLIKKLFPNILGYKKGYNVKSLLNYEDKDFIINAYRVILGREPDENGLRNNLIELRNNSKSKIEILMYLRNSQEGKRVNARVYNLRAKYVIFRVGSFIRKLPIIGYILYLVYCILGLPFILKNIKDKNMMLYRNNVFELEKIRKVMHEFNVQVQNKLESAKQSISSELSREISAANEKVKKDMATDIEQLCRKIETIENKIIGEICILEDQIRESGNQAKSEMDKLQVVVEQKCDEIDKLRKLVDQTRETDIKDLYSLVEHTCITKIEELRELVEDTCNSLANVMEKSRNEYSAVEEQISREAEERNERIVELNNATSKMYNDLYKRIDELTRQAKDHKLNILDQQRRLSILLEEVRRSIPQKDETSNVFLKEEEHHLDSLYVSFEDVFRGTRQDIKERLKVYLPYLEGFNRDKENIAILDVGCGRGEWLELLGENGYHAKGIDSNRIMVELCNSMNLNVELSDVIEYLRMQKSNSLDIVTGFHIVEHLPLKQLISLFDECLRVLRPNGLAIFETPNPENIVVGSCNFYIDPTHIKPIHPETLKFLLDARGFSRLETVKLHPLEYFSYDYRPDDLGSKIAFRFNMEQDYSIVAVKL